MTVALLDLRGSRFDGGLVSDVQDDRVRVAAGGTQCRGRLVATVLRPDSDHDRHTQGGELLGGCELQETNENLREAQARDRRVALALQEAMLPSPRPVGHHRAAVRYRPAAGGLLVCGDWYDLVDLTGDRTAVVGDVVGHGLTAACVMGQLRSALSAATLVADGPAVALEALGLNARSVEGAESTTVATTFIDWHDHTVTYSSAGHPAPVLLAPDGTTSFLDQATDPPLGARPEHVPRPQATVSFTEGATLVLP
jgi:serine phosphatase RsbU (regulator of sigma subunit)